MPGADPPPYPVSVTTRIHHLNCATMAPPLAARTGLAPDHLVAHCLMLERPDGLVLVDTGFGAADIAESARRLGRGFLLATGAALDPAETAASQVRGLGFGADDVTDVVVTHLDLDHAGGLSDFPHARVHVLGDELAAARARRTARERNRYRTAQWAHGPRWIEHHPQAADHWYGFGAVPLLDGDAFLVPLAGHTRGHSAVAVRRPSGGWFLHAGDAYFSHTEKDDPPRCPPGLRAFQAMVQVDKHARLANQDRLRSFHTEHGVPHGGDVTVFCAHDHLEYDALVGVTD